ncbi:MAG: LamG-like jellyroll fold domain-containing protein [Pirellulales bacterium]
MSLFLSAMAVALGFALVAPARAALVGEWNFNGSVLTDSSGNLNHGSFSGTPTPSFSSDTSLQLAGGNSVNFTGTSGANNTGHILVPDSNSLDITGAITISAWVRPVGNVSFDGILAKSPSSNGSAINHAGNYEFRIESGSRLLTFHYQPAGAVNGTIAHPSTGAVAAGLWQHVAVTAQAGGPGTFYINGAPAGAFAVNPGFGAVNTNPLRIGSRADLFTTMNGLIDDVALYNHVLTPAEIAALASGPGGVPPEQYPMIMPTYARASSEYIEVNDERLARHAVNGNGLVGKVHVNNPPGGTMWLTDGNEAPTFEIDLGGEFDLDDLRVWNYNENANAVCCLDRGVRTADIYVAGADGIYGATPAITGATFARAPGTPTDFSEVKSLAGQTARYILLQVTSNHGDPSFTGLSEVKVTGDGVPGKYPLPATIKSVSSNLVGFNRRAEYTANRAGMQFGDAHSADPEGTMWLNEGRFHCDAVTGVCTVPPDEAPEIIYDLGSEISLDRMKVYNYNEYRPDLPTRTAELLGRGVRITDVLVAGEDMVFRRLYNNLELAVAPEIGDQGDIGEVIDLPSTPIRFIKFDIESNHNGRDYNDPMGRDGFGDMVGLSEVQFFGVPEPSSCALVSSLVVFAGCVAARRKRNRA